ARGAPELTEIGPKIKRLMCTEYNLSGGLGASLTSCTLEPTGFPADFNEVRCRARWHDACPVSKTSGGRWDAGWAFFSMGLFFPGSAGTSGKPEQLRGRSAARVSLTAVGRPWANAGHRLTGFAD